MEKSMFVSAATVANDFGVSLGYAYKMIRQLNAELREKGYLTVAGRVSRKYYCERVYGLTEEEYDSKRGESENACV
jgi:hypothetical protein